MSASTNLNVIPLFGHDHGVRATYDYVDGQASYDKTVHRLGRLGSRALTLLGEVHLQEAANNPEEPEIYLNRATEAFSERIFSDKLGYDPKAAIRLAQLPLYKSIILDKQLPGPDILADSYGSVLWAAYTAANHFTFRDDQSSREGRELLGTISESMGLLLATRFALLNSLSSDWLPVQALITEDLMDRANTRGWDMSVYIPGEHKPEIAHKVQFKNSLRHIKRYSRDISVIAVNPDLTIDKETRIGSVDILSDLQKEANPFANSNRATKRLNRRTEKLLQGIDRAK